MVIKRVGPFSCAKIAGTLYFAVGLIAGAILSIVALAGGMSGSSSNPPGMGAMIGAGAIVAVPIFYGCIGFFGSLVVAALYNAVATIVGGIELDVDQPRRGAAAAGPPRGIIDPDTSSFRT